MRFSSLSANDGMKTVPAIFVALILLAVARLEAAITLVLTPAGQDAAHGSQVVFSGTLTNTSATEKVFLNDVQATLLPANANTFFANVPGILLPGETYSGVLFSVTLSASTPPGDYTGAITVKGGVDIFATGDLVSANFTASKTLLEYALNLEPAVTDPGLPPLPVMTDGYLTISYVPNSAASNLTFTVEASADLVHWGTANVETLVTPNPQPSNRVTVRYFPVNPINRIFLRLRVTRTSGSP
jgi:hypothetical protein